MEIRKIIKRWLYGSCPGFAGAFPYFGTKTYFPKGAHIFREVCAQGVFEAGNVDVLRRLVKPDTWFFDIGANIGLMAVPIVTGIPRCQLLSFEPSPGVLPYLRRTVSESAHSSRWHLVPKAVGSSTGRTSFSVGSAANSAFDGIKPTGRVANAGSTEIDMTTVDTEWKRLGCPVVSANKCDVEGAELGVLQGARECLAKMSPAVLVEWNTENLAAYGVAPESLLDFASQSKFQVLALPHFLPVKLPWELDLHMIRTENFLLLPNDKD
jgi:FkbM family methyltransferase